MNASKEFMQYIRKISYKDVYLILNVNVLPQLTQYMSLIEQIKFEDGSYHTYYCDLKRFIASFLTYWKYIIDDIIKEADRLMNVVDKEELLLITERTIDIHQDRHIEFGKGFLPINSPSEKQAYEEMEELYKEYMPKLYELKGQIEKFDKKEKVDNFAKSHFKITIAKTTELFQATHTFLSMMVADRIYQIRVSLEEIWLRLRNNLRDIRDKSEEALIGLLHELYEKNKELLLLTRLDRRSSIENAEAGHAIKKIRAKIEQYTYDPPLSRLEEEVAYLEKRIKDFCLSAEKIVLLKKEQDDVIKQEQIYNSMKTSELPGSRKQCWLNMGQNFAERKQYLKEKIIEAGRVLITFFSVRGHNRIMYNNETYRYYIDEYNHQVYVFNYGMEHYHMDCEGAFRKVSQKIPYYFDKFGRYIKDKNGEKSYQCDACTSQYKISTGNLLVKTSVDCGHSERLHQKCKMIIKDTIKFEILPDDKPVDIKRSMEPEVVRYLWDSFGHVLSSALRDVGCDKTRNPIQYLAHNLLLHKYNKTKTELSQKFKESQDYRANIFKERKEKAMEASKRWKSKQVKPRKPEESDDRDEREVRAAHAVQADIAQAMNLLTSD